MDPIIFRFRIQTLRSPEFKVTQIMLRLFFSRPMAETIISGDRDKEPVLSKTSISEEAAELPAGIESQPFPFSPTPENPYLINLPKTFLQNFW